MEFRVFALDVTRDGAGNFIHISLAYIDIKQRRWIHLVDGFLRWMLLNGRTIKQRFLATGACPTSATSQNADANNILNIAPTLL